MLTLYHFGYAICAQKVRVCLAEKGVAWESRLPGLRDPEYLKLNPNGYVPTLVHDDRILTESRLICEYIDEAFDGPSLMPADAYDRYRVGLWTKQIDDTLHLNVFTLSFAVSFRPRYQAMTPEEREKNFPFDITKRERAIDLLEKGFDSRFVGVALNRFKKLTADMERALSQSTWLVGETYSLADVDYTPYLQRITDLGLGFLIDDKPHLRAWFERVRARPSFDQVLGQWVAPEMIAGAAKAAAAAEPILRSKAA
jgi:glutathione S-transferase